MRISLKLDETIVKLNITKYQKVQQADIYHPKISQFQMHHHLGLKLDKR